jgi:hypothetical protein
MIAAILVILASLLGCSIAVEAHQINLTNARIIISPDRIVEVEFAIKGSDVDRVVGTRVFDDATGLVRPAALTAAAAIIVAYVEGHTTVLGEDGVSCRPDAAGVASDGDAVVVRVPWFCVGVADPLRYRSTVLIDVSRDARQVVLIGTGSCGSADPTGTCGLCHLGSDHRPRQLLVSRSHRLNSVSGGGRYAAARVSHRIRHSTFASPNQTVLGPRARKQRGLSMEDRDQEVCSAS